MIRDITTVISFCLHQLLCSSSSALLATTFTTAHADRTSNELTDMFTKILINMIFQLKRTNSRIYREQSYKSLNTVERQLSELLGTEVVRKFELFG